MHLLELMYVHRFIWRGAGKLPHQESGARTSARIPSQSDHICHSLSHPGIQEMAGHSSQAEFRTRCVLYVHTYINVMCIVIMLSDMS